MPKINIPIETQGFNTRKLKNLKSIRTDWFELIHAAVTVGKPPPPYFKWYGNYSINEIFSKIHFLFAYLKLSNGKLVKSDLYKDLDPTEKGAVSYFLGMTFTKLFASRYMQSPWLWHLSSFKKTGGNIKLSSGLNPDLLGRNSANQWLVFEAKGRSNIYSDAAMEKAKKQTGSVTAVNGVVPKCGVTAQVYFKDCLRMQVNDPEEFNEKFIEISLDERNLFTNYYANVIELLESSVESDTVSDSKFTFARITDLDVEIGLDTRIVDLVNHPDEPIGDVKLFHFGYESIGDNQPFRNFSDGLAVSLGKTWEPENMQKEPHSREIIIPGGIEN